MEEEKKSSLVYNSDMNADRFHVCCQNHILKAELIGNQPKHVITLYIIYIQYILCNQHLLHNIPLKKKQWLSCAAMLPDWAVFRSFGPLLIALGGEKCRAGG